MLLQRLVEYAEASGNILPPCYGRKAVRFRLQLDADGSPQSTQLTDFADPTSPRQRFGVAREVPSVTRTVGIAPALAVDNVEYVLGWDDQADKPDRVAKQAAAFQQLVRDWAAAEPDGPAPALAAFYAAGHHRRVVKPAQWSRSDLVDFVVDGQVIADHESARRYWASVAIGRKSLGRSGLCLVCGQVRELLKTIPQQIPQRWLPGATQGASLVSVNEAVHGYELTKFLAHTPICTNCGLTFMGALTDLLAEPNHSTSLPGQGARLAWWITGSSRIDPYRMLDEPDETQVSALIAGVTDGMSVDSGDLSMFCSVTVSGNVARVMVRDWVEMPVPRLKRHLHAWMTDHRIVDWSGQPSLIRFQQLIRAAGRWQPGRGGAAGSWIKLGAKGEDRPNGLQHQLMRTALLHRPVPPRLLGHVIHRISVDRRVDPARAALVRLTLLRRPGLSPAESAAERERLTPALNSQNRDPAYLSGRVFAILDDLQQTVYRRANQPLNTTFAERYMGRAIANPRSVLVSGRRSSTAWLRRLRGPLGRPAWANAYANRLDEVFAQFPAGQGIPGNLLLAQKAEFVLGYHQQRAQMRAERIEAAASKKTTDLPPDIDPSVDAGDDE